MWYTVTRTGYDRCRVWKISTGCCRVLWRRCTCEYEIWIEPLELCTEVSGDEAERAKNIAYQPTLPRHATVNTAFSPGGISFDSLASQENAGFWMSSYSVSYVSNTESSPSARACCAGAIVLSSKESRTKSIGNADTFSRVMRMLDLMRSLV